MSEVPTDSRCGQVVMTDDTIPELCQQFGCTAKVETSCPLCRGLFCAEHDPLWPMRRHDCLRGKAEAA